MRTACISISQKNGFDSQLSVLWIDISGNFLSGEVPWWQKKKSQMNKGKPVSALDVATYILSKQSKKSSLTAWKLQKLVYYSQARSLVWDEQPLFKEKILAWANGPVVKELYELHKGEFYVQKLSKGSADHLSNNQKDTIDHVLKAYGDKSAQWLSDLTHREMPWIEAREGLNPGKRGDVEIKLATMDEYYSGLNLWGQPIRTADG
jgi:uncharacterized phage-associated protein